MQECRGGALYGVRFNVAVSFPAVFAVSGLTSWSNFQEVFFAFYSFFEEIFIFIQPN